MKKTKKQSKIEIINSLINEKDILTVHDWKIICDIIKEVCDNEKVN